MENYSCPDELSYACTNESLEAIVRGLNPQPRDSILAICGSGDQAFAMLEKASKVTVVDYLPQQIEYFSKRKKLLKAGEFKKFRDLGREFIPDQSLVYLNSRNRYFSKERLETIRLNLEGSERTTEITGDIFDLEFPRKEFNKVYLSNALSYNSIAAPSSLLETLQEKLKRITELTTDNGLIYVTRHKFIHLEYHSGIGNEELLESIGLRIHKKSTGIVKKSSQKAIQGLFAIAWDPVVLQKIA